MDIVNPYLYHMTMLSSRR